MIQFEKLIIGRLEVELTFLNFKNALLLAQLSPLTEFKTLFEFLKSVVKVSNIPILNWTIEECYTVQCWYQLNFNIYQKNDIDFVMDESTGAVLSDYIKTDWNNNKTEVELNSEGDVLTLFTLDKALSVERVKMLFSDLPHRAYWEIGRLSACLKSELSQQLFDKFKANNQSYDNYLHEMITVLTTQISQFEFENLYTTARMALNELSHLVNIDCVNFVDYDKETNQNKITGGGFAMLPLMAEKGGVALPPVRFPVRSLLVQSAIRLVK